MRGNSQTTSGLLASLFLLAALACSGLSPPTAAQGKAAHAATARVFDYKGFTADISDIAGLSIRGEILAALRRQIDICEGAGLAPDKLAFIRSVPLALKIAEKGDAGSSGFYNGRAVTMRPLAYDFDKPILLHEFMDAYQHQRLPGGIRNPDVLTFYQRARRTPGLYPADSYMMLNVSEYFAMTASVFLHGSAASDPHTRANLKAKQPLYYDWLGKEFRAH